MAEEAGAGFPTTHWSIVVRARGVDPAGRRAALESLLTVYWRPVYAFLRRKGLSPDDAADTVQEFFARLLERDWLAAADKTEGRFRSFLMMAAQRFLSDQIDHDRALKRGGGWRRVPLDFGEAESRVGDDGPDETYRREWAKAVFERALARLRLELADTGRAAWFDVLTDFYGVGDGESVPYEGIARRRGVRAGDVGNILHRSRRRLRDIVLDEVRRTVAGPDELAAELRDLFENS